LASLHPTPAVGGYPKRPALDFIRKHESTGFDRGFYSGPLGFVGREEAEIVVAIRSGLVSREIDTMYANNGIDISRPKVSVYAGGKLKWTL
jgi:menaquinone-specific isochorismate synthase